MAVTLEDLISQMCMILGGVWAKLQTTSAGTTNSLVCTSLIGRTYGAGMRVQVANVDREIASMNRDTGVLVFRPANGTPIAANTVFTVTPRSMDELTFAATKAIRTMGSDWTVTRTTQSETSLDGVHEVWDLPSDCNRVVKVLVKPTMALSAGVLNNPYQQWEAWPWWELLSVDGVRKLRLTRVVAGPVLIEYEALITVPTALGDLIAFGAGQDRECVEFVVNRAVAELLYVDVAKAPTSEAANKLQGLAQRYEREAISARERKAAPVTTGQAVRRVLPKVR